MDTIISNAVTFCQALLTRRAVHHNQAMLKSTPAEEAAKEAALRERKALAAAMKLAWENNGKKPSVAELAKLCNCKPSAVYGWFKTGRIKKSNLAILAKQVHAKFDGAAALDDSEPESSPDQHGKSRYSVAGLRLALLFDHKSESERHDLWPSLVYMLARGDSELINEFLQYPTSPKRRSSGKSNAAGHGSGR